MKTVFWKKFKIPNPFMRRADRQIIYIIVVFIIITLLYKWVLNIVVFSKIFSPIGHDVKFSDNKFTNSRLVWPEDLPDGDRIREQMFYVPKGYKYDMTPIKRILIQTGIGNYWERPRLNQGEFIGCPVSQCWLTVNTSLGSEVDAVLFRHHYTRPDYKRPPNQIWIMELTEAPPYSGLSISDANAFNLTATYRWDSDLPRPYGYFMEHKPPLPDEPVNYPKNKTKKVAWFVSNCNPSSERQMYAAELAKYIDVDVYGSCGKLKCPRSNEMECFEMLETDYKFYLSFENSHCRHYITEKLFLNALSHNVVPVVMGPSRKEYELIAPKNSFIHVEDFESPEQLAAYLHKLDKNNRLYEEYFQWKNTGTIIIETRFYCRLCALLHDVDRSPSHYEDINEWWRGEGVCRSNYFDSKRLNHTG